VTSVYIGCIVGGVLLLASAIRSAILADRYRRLLRELCAAAHSGSPYALARVHAILDRALTEMGA
jgi:hypothetical protein